MDAAIAALFCNGIVNSHSMGLGGGFFMVSYNHQTKTAESLIAREKAPSGAHQDMFADKTGLGYWDNNSNPSRTGGLAVGVPGELRGYWEAWRKHGSLDWPDLIAPSIRLCRRGYNMTKHQYDMLHFRKTAIQNDPNLRATFIDPETNAFKTIGSLVYPVKLCDTLERIASQGGDVLYNGALTHSFVKDIQSVGGIITQQDLYNYSPEWVDPVSVKLHGGETVFSVPPPGSGSLLTFILSVLDGYNITKSKDEFPEKDILTVHRMIESFKYAFARRTELGDPKFVNITELMSRLSSPEYAQEIRQNITDYRTFQDPDHYGAVYFSNDDHGTAHVSVISAEGDAVSVTSTVNLYFGAGVTSASTGIILNSVMDDFSIPEELNYFGLSPTPNNYIAPNKRPLSSAAPAIVINADGSVRLVIGAGGGTKIPTAVAWVIIRHLWYQEDIKQAIDASRLHHQLMPMEVSYEYGVLQQIIEALEEIGHKTSRYRDRGSIICAVAKENGKVYANVDFRKGGEVDGLD